MRQQKKTYWSFQGSIVFSDTADKTIVPPDFMVKDFHTASRRLPFNAEKTAKKNKNKGKKFVLDTKSYHAV